MQEQSAKAGGWVGWKDERQGLSLCDRSTGSLQGYPECLERRLHKWTEAKSGRDLYAMLESVNLILKAPGSL